MPLNIKIKGMEDIRPTPTVSDMAGGHTYVALGEPLSGDQIKSADDGQAGVKPPKKAGKTVHAVSPKPSKKAPVELGGNIEAGLLRPSSRNTGKSEGSNRQKYVCASCSDAAWGKPTLKLICGKCHKPMIPGKTSEVAANERSEVQSGT